MDPNQINPDSIVCWSSAPVSTEVNEEVILMNVDRDRCYGLGSTGSDIWRRIRTPIRVSELSSQLEDEYAAQPGVIESDVLRTLRQLAAEGLIEVLATSN
ncbi:MAG: hypothetical protein NVSMB62_08710 [Acidobacteriaceae bacterium]